MGSDKTKYDRFVSFMNGFSAAVQLGQRAQDNGSFIESVCLSASLIDATLRIGLILKHQLDTKSNAILDELLYQSNEDQIVTERSIYKQALKQGIISQDIYETLNKLYYERNKVVHQYIISEITTDQVVQIAAKYADTVHIVKNAVRKLEDEQIARGIGMTVSGNSVPKSVRRDIMQIIDEEAAIKHGNPCLDKNLRHKGAS